jgi:hypothetical protein
MAVLSNRHDGPDDLRDVRLGTMIGANQKDDTPLVAVSVHSRPIRRWMLPAEIRDTRMWDVVPALVGFEQSDVAVMRCPFAPSMFGVSRESGIIGEHRQLIVE